MSMTDWTSLHGSHFENARVCVTGGAGFIGSHLTEALIQLGATVSIKLNGTRTETVGIVYDPSSSSTLAELPPGEQIEDSFNYGIMDRYGGTDTAKISIGITGEESIAISPVPTQFATVDSLIDAIELTLSDPDGDASELQLSVESSHPDVVPPENLVLTGSGSSRWLAIQPATGVHGRTRISVTASDGARPEATQRFSVIAGLEEDLDLDGLDQLAMHMLCHQDEQLLAYQRCLPPGHSYPESSLGRIVVCPAARGLQLGKELVSRGISYNLQHWPKTDIRINAQAYLRGFYTDLGFETRGDVYDEGGIPHLQMLYRS